MQIKLAMLNRPPSLPTPIQDIAINLVFAAMGEEIINRTSEEYSQIAAGLPPLKVLIQDINQLLQERHERQRRTGVPMPELCRFKARDQRITFEPYPNTISRETLRAAL
jgi:hypothetical protein